MNRNDFCCRPRSFFLLAVTLGCFLALPAAALADGPTAYAADQDRPRILYRQAEVAYSAGHYDEARKLLLEAWGVRQTYDVAAALGQAELELELYRDAAEHLSFAVRNFAPMESERVLEDLKGDLRSAKSQVAEARIAVSEPRAAVVINGKPIGQSPLSATVFLEPGPNTIEASLGPDRRASKRMALAKGGSYDVSLVLPPPAPAPSSGRDPGSGHDSPPSYLPATISAAVGGAAVLTGVGLLIAASAKDNRRGDLESSLGGTNSCGARADVPVECAQISRLAWDASMPDLLSTHGSELQGNSRA